MSVEYKVWVDVEECLNLGTKDEVFQDLDLPFGCLLVTDSESEAVAFAEKIHNAGLKMKGEDS